MINNILELFKSNLYVFLIVIDNWEKSCGWRDCRYYWEMERILEETLEMFQSDKCVSKHAESPHAL